MRGLNFICAARVYLFLDGARLTPEIDSPGESERRRERKKTQDSRRGVAVVAPRNALHAQKEGILRIGKAKLYNVVACPLYSSYYTFYKVHMQTATSLIYMYSHVKHLTLIPMACVWPINRSLDRYIKKQNSYV